MRELYVATCKGAEEDGDEHSFDYYVLIDQMEVNGGFACESYGAKIASSNGAHADVPHITTSISRIDELMTLLTKNLVTPISLNDVIADWL